MYSALYNRLKQVDGPTFEVSILCIMYYKVCKAVQMVLNIVG